MWAVPCSVGAAELEAAEAACGTALQLDNDIVTPPTRLFSFSGDSTYASGSDASHPADALRTAGST